MKTVQREKYALHNELFGYEQEGIALYLNGKPSSSYEIVTACSISEENQYMRDYLADEKGVIHGIDFNEIVEKNRK